MVSKVIDAYKSNTSIPNKLVKITVHNRKNSVSCKNGMHLNIWHFAYDVVNIINTHGLMPVSRSVS